MDDRRERSGSVVIRAIHHCPNIERLIHPPQAAQGYSLQPYSLLCGLIVFFYEVFWVSGPNWSFGAFKL